ncbi:cytochrome b5-like [Arctopsyche grandis]|uniref:cytochrome b5-like n=1 Tax=Arctopsyche grandis TaxID=121162 RepID=UPI00406D639E
MTSEDVKEYSLSEVATKNGKDGAPCWIVVRDKVYDVGSFMIEHPGGADLIEEVLGTDATKDFDDAGHSNDAITILKKTKIGILVETDRKYDKKKKKKPAEGGEKKKKKPAEDGEKKKKRSCKTRMTCGVC